MKRHYILGLIALTIISLTGCQKEQKIEEPTTVEESQAIETSIEVETEDTKETQTDTFIFANYNILDSVFTKDCSFTEEEIMVSDYIEEEITDENGYCPAFSISRINVVDVEDLNTIPKEIIVTDVNSYYDVYILDDGQYFYYVDGNGNILRTQ